MSPIRGKRKVKGQWKEVGSYLIDIETKSVGRVVKATGVFPSTKNSLDLVQQIKLMIKDLDTTREIEKLTQIKDGKVKLLSALSAWKAGRINFAEVHADELLAKSLHTWIKNSTASPYTIQQYSAYLKRLEKLEIITSKSTVKDIPEIVRQLRARFDREKKAIYFANIRKMFTSFMTQALGYEDESPLLTQVRRTKRIKIAERREHQPLRSVGEFIELAKRINPVGRWGNRKVDYKQWIYFMVLTGMRPTEFERGLWERDKKTGHIRIKGTKTKNAVRVVPNISWLAPEERTLSNLQMRLLRLDPPTEVRCRDFRRTAAVWWEQSKVPRSRYSYYLGHGARDITGLYEARTPTQEELDQDRDAMMLWMREQRFAGATKRKKPWSQKLPEFIEELEAS